MEKKVEEIVEVEAENKNTKKSGGRNQKQREAMNAECDRIDRMVREGIGGYRVVKE